MVKNCRVQTNSYLIFESKNVVKFYVHIRPIFSCWVTYMDNIIIITLHDCFKVLLIDVRTSLPNAVGLFIESAVPK